MVAIKDTRSQDTSVPQNTGNCLQAPPPVSVSRIAKKSKDFIVPCQLCRGQQVVIASNRANRFHFNGKTGKIAAVIYPQDASRTIVYVRLEDASPCFFAHEICLILNQKSGGAA